jgi:hypothetical protein
VREVRCEQSTGSRVQRDESCASRNARSGVNWANDH